MTTLHENKRHLTGAALNKRLAELDRLANEEDAKAMAAKAGRDDYRARAAAAGEAYLEHVRKAGEYLDEAKWRTGGGGRWGKWSQRFAERHGIKERTQRQYRDVARNWSHPKIEEARAQGVVIDSIKKFMAIKRSGPPNPLPKVTPRQMERDNATYEIRKEFALYLESLDSFEVSILHATLDSVLAVANADLKERVCGNHGGPYYKHREEYYREQAAEMRTPPTDGKKMSRRDAVRDAERLAAADMKKAQVAKWNELPVPCNTERPARPRRGRRPPPGGRSKKK